jgi:hypothetical protein
MATVQVQVRLPEELAMSLLDSPSSEGNLPISGKFPTPHQTLNNSPIPQPFRFTKVIVVPSSF